MSYLRYVNYTILYLSVLRVVTCGFTIYSNLDPTTYAVQSGASSKSPDFCQQHPNGRFCQYQMDGKQLRYVESVVYE